MTLSIAARCVRTGMFGVAIASSSPAVAARCSFVRAGVGAACSQNLTDPDLGPILLDAMAAGAGAEEAIRSVKAGRAFITHRQLLAVDAAGGAAAYSGGDALGIFGHLTAENAAAGGNLLADAGVPRAMLAGFAAAVGHLGERLLRALEAGLAAGGEAGPLHSAGLKVADRLAWPIVDLRCDWDDAPVERLRAAWEVYHPQIAAYVQRAADPTQAPSFGVPGDEARSGRAEKQR